MVNLEIQGVEAILQTALTLAGKIENGVRSRDRKALETVYEDFQTLKGLLKSALRNIPNPGGHSLTLRLAELIEIAIREVEASHYDKFIDVVDGAIDQLDICKDAKIL